MRYAQIRSMDISDGPGIRIALYTQGCPIRCEGCHNKSIWEFDGGLDFTEHTIEKLIQLAQSEYVAGLSILGGEPLIEQNFAMLTNLCLKFKATYPAKTIWLWTGYTFDKLLTKYATNKQFMALLAQLDVIVDGPFLQKLKDITLAYAGSSNQRVIDVRKSLKKHKVCLYTQAC